MSLFKDLDPANISKLLYISLLVAVVTIIWMYRLGEPIRGTKTNIILALELVRTEEIAKDILEDLDGTEIAAVRKITYVDFLFIPAYMLFLSNLWLLIIIRLSDHPWSGFFTLAGALFIIAAMVAGSFDLVENIYLLKVLKGVGHPAPTITTIFAALKWALLIPTLFFGLTLEVFVWVTKLLSK